MGSGGRCGGRCGGSYNRWRAKAPAPFAPRLLPLTAAPLAASPRHARSSRSGGVVRLEPSAMAALASSIGGRQPAHRARDPARIGALACISTASAAAATRQAPMPRAEPFKVWAKAATAAGAQSRMCASRMAAWRSNSDQHLGFEAALPQRHARQMLEIDGFDRRRRQASRSERRRLPIAPCSPPEGSLAP